jgi:hypothetical protein
MFKQCSAQHAFLELVILRHRPHVAFVRLDDKQRFPNSPFVFAKYKPPIGRSASCSSLPGSSPLAPTPATAALTAGALNPKFLKWLSGPRSTLVSPADRAAGKRTLRGTAPNWNKIVAHLVGVDVYFDRRG